MKILIVGAGIGGLSTALALEKIGISPTIIEKSSFPRLDGAGIALPRNAMELLAFLGLKDSLLAAGKIVNSITYALSSGDILSKSLLSSYFSDIHPFIGVKRKLLIELMRQKVQSTIQFNKTISAINYSANNTAIVKFNSGHDELYDLIVGADGIYSYTRKLISPSTSIEDLGLTTFRFLATHTQDDPVYYFDEQSAFMIYPVNDHEVYCYGHMPHTAIGQSNLLNAVKNHFSNYKGTVKSLIEANKDNIVWGKLLSVETPVTSVKNVLLVGDASHACSPMLQQGASSALEDAITLAVFLKKTKNIQSTLEHYELFRKPRIDWVKINSDMPLKSISNNPNQIDREKTLAYIIKNGPLNVLKWRELFVRDYLDSLEDYMPGCMLESISRN